MKVISHYFGCQAKVTIFDLGFYSNSHSGRIAFLGYPVLVLLIPNCPTNEPLWCLLISSVWIIFDMYGSVFLCNTLLVSSQHSSRSYYLILWASYFSAQTSRNLNIRPLILTEYSYSLTILAFIVSQSFTKFGNTWILKIKSWCSEVKFSA